MSDAPCTPTALSLGLELLLTHQQVTCQHSALAACSPEECTAGPESGHWSLACLCWVGIKGAHFGHSSCSHGAGSEEKALTGKRVIQMCGTVTGVDDPPGTWGVSPSPWSPRLASLRREAGLTGRREHRECCRLLQAHPDRQLSHADWSSCKIQSLPAPPAAATNMAPSLAGHSVRLVTCPYAHGARTRPLRKDPLPHGSCSRL